GGDITGSTMAQVLPPAKLGRGNYIAVYSPTGTATVGANSGSGNNFYEINGFSALTAADGSYDAAPQMTPPESYNIDQKIDDGAPNTGGVRATGADDTGAISQEVD